MKIERLPKQAYIMMKALDQNGKNCWVTAIREILFKTGFGYVWINQGVSNVNKFITVFKQRLVDRHLQEWSASVSEKERYILYKSVLQTFGLCSYFDYLAVYCFG